MMNQTTNSDLVEAKTRLTNAQADMKEMQLAILQAEYVKRKEVSKQWSDQASRVRSKLLSLPVRLAGVLSRKEYMPSEVESIVQANVNEVLQELAEDFMSEGDNDDE